MREVFKGRVNLSEKASQAAFFMVHELTEENPHVRINPSKLCSWIIENYLRDHFSKEKERIVQEHFNPRRFLLESLKDVQTGEDIKSLFKTALDKMDKGPLASSQKRRQRIKNGPGQGIETVERPPLVGS